MEDYDRIDPIVKKAYVVFAYHYMNKIISEILVYTYTWLHIKILQQLHLIHLTIWSHDIIKYKYDKIAYN